jgi:hypothetical protein
MASYGRITLMMNWKGYGSSYSQFNIMYEDMSGGTENIYKKKISQDSQCPGQDSN